MNWLPRAAVGVFAATLLVCIGLAVPLYHRKYKVDISCEDVRRAQNVFTMRSEHYAGEIQDLARVAPEHCEQGLRLHGAFVELIIPFGIYACSFDVDPCSGSLLRPPEVSLITPND